MESNKKNIIPDQTIKTATPHELNNMIADLSSDSPIVHEDAIRKLRELGDTRALEPLIKALKSGKIWGYWSLKEALTTLDKLDANWRVREEQNLIDLLDDDSPYIRKTGINLISILQVPDLSVILLSITKYDSDNDVKKAAEEALINAGFLREKKIMTNAALKKEDDDGADENYHDIKALKQEMKSASRRMGVIIIIFGILAGVVQLNTISVSDPSFIICFMPVALFTILGALLIFKPRNIYLLIAGIVFSIIGAASEILGVLISLESFTFLFWSTIIIATLLTITSGYLGIRLTLYYFKFKVINKPIESQ